LLLSDFPDIYAEWADELNATDKRTVRAGTDAVAHWRCAGGHVWMASIGQRTIRQTRCGDCVTARANATSSVAALWPELPAEWHREANLPLTPERTKITYDRAIWWRCRANRAHPPYKMAPRTRGARDVGCRTCRRERHERQNRKRAA
ncbi:MAG: zinc-ribbon domain-containing protein, partial [Dehalococcoidia bacterium]